MNLKELRNGEWVEYNNHPVEVIGIDEILKVATVYDHQNQKQLTLTENDLIADPQCHCDSYQYY
ncbi:hypothetical protein BGP78_05855 [Pseudoalteromonas sp. MSK9-3]|uniref:hypothetical protein n=1 Tax=Pseudoalteromonas sp. MSK9-3 TaxID=1897633 RepID=UPI000E6C49D6|nr:hypothetical protein [Pseudoalteromonas sp. MSK9-3]RJE78213.1 hypothetical protein BGP78_05855 [Pseudoalteromonas sp. MSK9-3]